MRTLGGILATGGTADVTRLGWPTLRAGFPLMTFLNAMREMRTALTKRAAKDTAPVMAVIGAGAGQDRSIAALNIALAAARDGAKVLMIDADHKAHALSNKVSQSRQERAQPSRLAQHRHQDLARHQDRERNFDPAGRSRHPDAKAGDAIRKAIAQARSAGGYDLVILDGPAMPWSPADRKLFDARRRARRDPAGQPRHQRQHGRHHHSARRDRAQAGRCRPQRTQPHGRQPSARQTICVSVA